MKIWNKHYWLKRALEFALKKPAPNRIPLTGESAQENDCYTSEIRSLNGDAVDLLVDGVSEHGVQGKIMADGSYSLPCSIPFALLDDIQFSTTHYIGKIQFKYDSPFDLLWSDVVKREYFQIRNDKKRQIRYNSNTKERTDRIELLKHVVELRLEFGMQQNQVVPLNVELTDHDVFRLLYGDRIYNHPRYRQIFERFKLLLESLVDSGDVNVQSSRYKATGKSLTTIATYEEETQRHNEQVIHNIWIKWLTIIIALTAITATIFQVYEILTSPQINPNSLAIKTV